MDLNNLMQIAMIVLGVLLIVVILLQQRGASLGAGFGGSSELYTTRRGVDKTVFDVTVVLAILFIMSIMAAIFLPSILN